MKAKELNERLKTNIHAICQMLLPNGKVNGGYFEAGDITGSSGQSLKVNLGDGWFKDYACDTHKGDILDLWALSRGLGIKQAMTQVHEYLNIPNDNVFVKYDKKKFVKPDKPNGTPLDYQSEAGMWLRETKRISQKTIDAFKVEVRGSTIITPYIKEGVVRMYKFRDMSAEWAGEKKKIWANKEPFKCLLGWHLIPENARTVIICEGETDTLTYYEQGFNVLGVPFGAGGGSKQDWIDNDFEDLERFDKICISMDMDGPGKEAVKEIMNRLGSDVCWVVDLPENDASECHMKGINLGEFIKKAKTVDPAELKNVLDFKDDVWIALNPELRMNDGVTLPWASTFGKLRFRDSELTVWMGMDGHGKSQLVGQVMADVVRQNKKCCIASMEMAAGQTLKRIYTQIAGSENAARLNFDAIGEWLSKGLWIFDKLGTADTKKILEVFKYARKRYGIKQFVIDSLTKCIDDEDDYNAQKRFMNDICDFVILNGCHVHLIVHPRKQKDEDVELNKFDVKGSGSITNLAFNLVTVWRNKDKENRIMEAKEVGGRVDDETMRKADCIVKCIKQRNFDWEGRIKLWYNYNSKQYRDEFDGREINYLAEVKNGR